MNSSSRFSALLVNGDGMNLSEMAKTAGKRFSQAARTARRLAYDASPRSHSRCASHSLCGGVRVWLTVRPNGILRREG
jgi:hypothetical protein